MIELTREWENDEAGALAVCIVGPLNVGDDDDEEDEEDDEEEEEDDELEADDVSRTRCNDERCASMSLSPTAAGVAFSPPRLEALILLLLPPRCLPVPFLSLTISVIVSSALARL